MSDLNLSKARKPPPLHLPPSSNTVDISIINTTSRIQDIPASLFVEPSYKSFTHLDCPAFSFLISHLPTRQKYLFDLGIRKDWRNLAPYIFNRVTNGGWTLTVDKGVAEILQDGGIDPAEVQGIIWSHSHWDHTGDPSTFPTSTSLIVGPGFKDAFTPGFPQNQDAPILESDYAGRELREISFDSGLKLGRFGALDFFGDGSFYLLDTPGHAVGHMCALARTTAGDDPTFMFLGGDVAHHGGEFRPSPFLPLPQSLGPSPIPNIQLGICPGELLAQQHRLYPDKGAWTTPFVSPSKNAAHDIEKALTSIEGMEEFDGNANIFTCVAHDASLLGVVGCFPEETANEWREKGWRERSLWKWAGDYSGGVALADPVSSG